MTAPDETFIRVVHHLEKDGSDWPTAGSERLWAAEIPGRPRHASIRNILAYGRGLAFADVVLTSPIDGSDDFRVERVVSRSGHSTVHIIVLVEKFLPDVEDLLHLVGADWNHWQEHTYLACDIPADSDYAVLRDRLQFLAAKKIIRFQEAYVSDTHRANLAVPDRPTFP